MEELNNYFQSIVGILYGQQFSVLLCTNKFRSHNLQNDDTVGVEVFCSLQPSDAAFNKYQAIQQNRYQQNTY